MRSDVCEEVVEEAWAAAKIDRASCSRTSRNAFAGSLFELAAGAIFSPIQFFPLGWLLYSDVKWGGTLAGSYGGNGNCQFGKQIAKQPPETGFGRRQIARSPT